MPGMHNRRARPTLRVLSGDLTTDWASPQPQRALASGELMDLHPLSELQHPIIIKAAQAFGPDPAHDNFVGPIHSSTHLRLLEVRATQWRGGVWTDAESGVRWLVVAGLAKGDHLDHDDFYERVKRADGLGDPNHWLPTRTDLTLLKQKTAARLRVEWELEVQRSVLSALRLIHSGGSHQFEVPHPIPTQGPLGRVSLTVTPVRDTDYMADEVLVEFAPEARYLGSQLLWQLVVRVLISIEPPEQGWDRHGESYSNIAEPGAWKQRVDDLAPMVEANELAVSEPGSMSHYAHRRGLVESTVEGTAVRSLCGVYFVPAQDHEAMPACPTCDDRLDELPH